LTNAGIKRCARVLSGIYTGFIVADWPLDVLAVSMWNITLPSGIYGRVVNVRPLPLRPFPFGFHVEPAVLT
jgi:hypothetical protein